MVYLFILLLILVPFVKYDILAKKGGEGLWFYITLISLICLAAFRYRVGGDTIIYMDIFTYYPKISELSSFDFETAEFNPMWYIYNSVFKSLGNSFFLFQLTQAIIINTVFFRFFYKYTNYFFTAILIYYVGYYVYLNFEIQREVLSICLFIIAYPFLENGKYLKYYLIVLVAISIHYSAILLLFVPLFLLLKRDNFWVSIAIVAVVTLLFSLYNIIEIAVSLFFDTGAYKISNYLMIDAPNTIGATIQMLKMVPFILVFYLRKKLHIDCNQNMGAILTMVIIIQSASMFVPVIPRLSNYLIPLGIVFIVNTIMRNFQLIRKKQITTILAMSVCFIYFFNLGYFYITDTSEVLARTREYRRYVPYVSIFNPHMDYTRERIMINERVNRVLE